MGHHKVHPHATRRDIRVRNSTRIERMNEVEKAVAEEPALQPTCLCIVLDTNHYFTLLPSSTLLSVRPFRLDSRTPASSSYEPSSPYPFPV
jgi:hypothetical protein